MRVFRSSAVRNIYGATSPSRMPTTATIAAYGSQRIKNGRRSRSQSTTADHRLGPESSTIGGAEDVETWLKRSRLTVAVGSGKVGGAGVAGISSGTSVHVARRARAQLAAACAAARRLRSRSSALF
jgi:hypothetical protein